MSRVMDASKSTGAEASFRIEPSLSGGPEVLENSSTFSFLRSFPFHRCGCFPSRASVRNQLACRDPADFSPEVTETIPCNVHVWRGGGGCTFLLGGLVCTSAGLVHGSRRISPHCADWHRAPSRGSLGCRVTISSRPAKPKSAVILTPFCQ
jgi:hypothetical protein